MSNTLKTILVSEYSVGKSSFLNAIAGTIIAPTSTIKETSRIEFYKLRMITSLVSDNDYNFTDRKNYNKTTKNNLLFYSDCNKIYSVEPEIEINSNFNMDIYDFPSRNGEVIIEKYYDTIFDAVKYPDLIIFMVNASEIYNDERASRLINIIHYIIKKAFFTDIIVVFNKYDQIDDEDYSYSFNKYRTLFKETFGDRVGIYRFNTRKYFIHNIKTSILQTDSKIYMNELRKMGVRIVYPNSNLSTLNSSTHNGDWDNLLQHLEEKYQEISEDRTTHYDTLIIKIIELLSSPSSYKIYDFVHTLTTCKTQEKWYNTLLLKILRYIIEKSSNDKILLDQNMEIVIGNNTDMGALFIPFIIRINPEHSTMEYITNIVLYNDMLYDKFTTTTKILILRSLLEHFHISETSKIFDRLYDLKCYLNFTAAEIDSENFMINKIYNNFIDNEMIKSKNPDVWFVLKLAHIPKNILKIFFPKIEDNLSIILGKKIVFYMKLLLEQNVSNKYVGTFGLDLLSEMTMKNMVANILDLIPDVLEGYMKFFITEMIYK